MEITDEIRAYAREHYGPAMVDYLAACARATWDGDTWNCGRTLDAAGTRKVEARPGADVLRMRTTEFGSSDAALLPPALAMQHGWDALFMADAVRWGWLT